MDEVDDVERRVAVTETRLEDLQIRLDRFEEKLDYLINCEADRKAQDKVLEKYGKAAFWGVISIGGLINWDKLVHIFDGLFKP